MAYRVVAGYVTVEMDVPGGRARRDVRLGEILPADVPEAEIRMLLERGDLVAVDEPAADPGPEEGDPDPDAVPDGAVPEVLAWVGDDPARAERALALEQADGGKNRKGVVDPLTELLTRPAE
jgi:hypothetical protein